MATQPSDEYGDFVGSLVPLDQAQEQHDDARWSPFEALAGRLAGSGGGGGGLSLFSGPCLLLAAAALAAALPSEGVTDDSFWRVAQESTRELLSVGSAVGAPLALGAAGLGILAAVGAVRGGQLAATLLVAQPLVGGAGVAGVGLLWVAFLGLALANLAVLLLIIVAYVIATIIVIAIVIGMLIGLASGGR